MKPRKSILFIVLTAIGVLITVGTGIFKVQTVRVLDASAYGFPLPWIMEGGFGLAVSTDYSWVSFVLDLLFYVVVGYVLVLGVRRMTPKQRK